MDWLELLLILLFIVGPTLWGVLRGEGQPDNSERPVPVPSGSAAYVLKPEGKDILYQALAEFLDPRGVDKLLGRYLGAGATLNYQEFQYVKGLVAGRLGRERAEAVMNAAFTRLEAGGQPVRNAPPVSPPPAPVPPLPSAASPAPVYTLAPRGRETLTQALERFLGRDATTTLLSRNITAGGRIDAEGYRSLEALLALHLGPEEAGAILRSALATSPSPQPATISPPAPASQTPLAAGPISALTPQLAAAPSLRAGVTPLSSSLTRVHTSTTSRPTPTAPGSIQAEPWLDLTSRHAVLNGFIWHEILGEPRSRQIHALRRTPRKKV